MNDENTPERRGKGGTHRREKKGDSVKRQFSLDILESIFFEVYEYTVVELVTHPPFKFETAKPHPPPIPPPGGVILFHCCLYSTKC